MSLKMTLMAIPLPDGPAWGTGRGSSASGLMRRTMVGQKQLIANRMAAARPAAHEAAA
ncbi:hypothetical protein X907_0588 [Glycocaulis alkaliphilus]|uniref:Uncharacterized protein n=1 Tax=Glycocaulis alkaliphilus TaxID=1434191 RepID=A0A3T0E6U5_9PROT|nr:hypothetical protein X907_0588 [Glycocaulis alkaliphilus]